MKSADARVPINGTHSRVLRSEQGVTIAVSPSVCHHLTLRLTFSKPAFAGVLPCDMDLKQNLKTPSWPGDNAA
jgi:hypothetical protein